jgi:hypothetical protein
LLPISYLPTLANDADDSPEPVAARLAGRYTRERKNLGDYVEIVLASDGPQTWPEISLTLQLIGVQHNKSYLRGVLYGDQRFQRTNWGSTALWELVE